MAFFNKKEDVIDIKLTQYGKSLLAKGKFKPVSYAFFDDNVLYDIAYAGDSEDQNDIEPRIQEDTPSLRAQHIFYGAETEVKRIVNEVRGTNGEVPTVQPVADKHYALSAPLRTSALHTTEIPAWQIRFFGSELLGSIEYATGSHPTTKIPQLRSEIVYKTQIRDVNAPAPVRQESMRMALQEYTDATSLFQDGTYFYTVGDQLLIEIDEKNTDFMNDNFMIEIFEVEEVDVSGSISTPSVLNPTKKEVLRPLNFRKKRSNVVNNVLVDYDDTRATPESMDDVSYYFDVRVDSEIPTETLCAIYQQLKSAGEELGSLETLDLNCPEAEVPFNLYASNITDEDIEECKD